MMLLGSFLFYLTLPLPLRPLLHQLMWEDGTEHRLEQLPKDIDIEDIEVKFVTKLKHI